MKLKSLQQRVKKVLKHSANGRTYAYKDGVGYKHYTKGNRVRHLTSDRLSQCATKYLEFLASIFPKPETTEKGEVNE